MDKVSQLIRQKPLLFIVISVAYLSVAGLLKWQFKPPLEALFYLVGGLIGVYFLDVAEVFFRLTPSPFRSVVFAVPFTIVSFFVVTSSGSLLASGLVLTLYLQLILWQIGEWQMVGNLNSWYRMVAGGVNQTVQRWWIVVFIGLFIVETYLFVR